MKTLLTSPAKKKVDATSTTQLVRLSGISLLIGGLIATTAWIFHAIVDPGRVGYNEPWWLPLNMALSSGAILMALGLPGFHACQASRTGKFGLIGLVLLFSGMLMAYVGVQTLEAFSRPDIPATIGILASIAAPTFFFGIIITSAVTWRADVYPRVTAALLGLSALFGLLTRLVYMPAWLGMNLIPAFFTVVMAWLGIVLVRSDWGK